MCSFGNLQLFKFVVDDLLHNNILTIVCVIMQSALRAILVQTAEINAVITVTRWTLATKLLDDVMEDVNQDGRDSFAMKVSAFYQAALKLNYLLVFFVLHVIIFTISFMLHITLMNKTNQLYRLVLRKECIKILK